MGCEQSTPIALPESINPLYKNTSIDSSSGVKVPAYFCIGKHNRPYNRQVLETNIDNKVVTVEASSTLVVKSDDIVFAVAKHVLRKGYCVFRPTPVYRDQKPTNHKYKGNPLYEYAAIKNRGVSFVHKHDPNWKLVNGPTNSFEKYLVENHDNNIQVAMWKYDTHNQVNMATVTEPGHDIVLILCLVILADLIDYDEQMNGLAKSAAASVVIGGG